MYFYRAEKTRRVFCRDKCLIYTVSARSFFPPLLAFISVFNIYEDVKWRKSSVVVQDTASIHDALLRIAAG